MSKWRKLSSSLLNFTQQAFINGDEFLPHLQIWFHKCVNIHKWALKRRIVHDSDFKRKQKGEREYEWKLQKETAHRDGHATVNFLSYIKCIHFYDFSRELQEKKKLPQRWLQCNQHPCLFCLWGFICPSPLILPLSLLRAGAASRRGDLFH